MSRKPRGTTTGIIARNYEALQMEVRLTAEASPVSFKRKARAPELKHIFRFFVLGTPADLDRRRREGFSEWTSTPRQYLKQLGALDYAKECREKFTRRKHIKDKTLLHVSKTPGPKPLGTVAQRTFEARKIREQRQTEYAKAVAAKLWPGAITGNKIYALQVQEPGPYMLLPYNAIVQLAYILGVPAP